MGQLYMSPIAITSHTSDGELNSDVSNVCERKI